MRSIRSIAGFLITGLVGITAIAFFATAPVAAHASTHASVSVVAGSSHVSVSAVDTVCPYHSGHFVTYTNGCASWTN